MKLNVITFILITASPMLTSGCKKPAQSPQLNGEERFYEQKSVAQPSAVLPRMSDPKVPNKGAEALSPLPSQVGDRSGEAHKNGSNKNWYK